MLNDLLSGKILLLDGAMGTMLQKSGLPPGGQPEMLCLTNEELICSIHRQYIESGSRVIYTNTFGANRRKLAGTGVSVAALVHKAVSVARRACGGTGALAALDIGPLGELLEPMGTLSFEEAYDMFREIIVSGRDAGADLIVIETMTDLYETKAALLAAKEHTGLPVFATMTFDENGRTFTGCHAASMACVLEGLGADAIGVNCSLGPAEIYRPIEEISRYTSLPLIVKPNAGLPDPVDGRYHLDPDTFAKELVRCLDAGVSIFGGCCGTSPEYIRTLAHALDGATPAKRNYTPQSIVCTPSLPVPADRVRVIGERINPTGKKRFQQALLEQDFDYIVDVGLKQADAGADILDVNVGFPGVDEKEMMAQAVKRLQSVLSLPLQLDSADPAALEAGLRVYNGKAAVNSVNGDPKVLAAVLPVVKKYGAAVVGLTLDENGLPETAEQRFAIARRIFDACLCHGIKKEDVWIDCLTLTVSAQQSQAAETLKAVRMVKEQLGLKTVLGVSNISFGLPNRELITESFLVQALSHGLALPILNPNQRRMMDAVAAFRVLCGEDKDSAAFIRRFAAAPAEPAAGAPAAILTLEDAIARGLKTESRRLAEALLLAEDELALINRRLIPALDRVGDRYERGEIFLPQLIGAAGAANEVFEAVKKSMAAKGGGSVSKGKIIVATVRGDIHDIGKNIVKTILENYGYQVIDLGRDVPPERVVEAAVGRGVGLVGLSALMTTTLPSMQKTIEALRASGHPCAVFVGGAVLTEEYAKKIGADFYAKDARQAVAIAKQILG